MAKPEQALVLDPPAELHFKPPFTDVTTSYLNLFNPTKRDICFKVKTTAPKTYCVRPNNGVVQPNETVPVAVMLQPRDLETADRNKHKFMVQSMFAPDGQYSQDSVWRDVPPEGLMNSKLKCVFDMPSDPAQVSEDVADSPPKVETEATTAEVQELPSKVIDAAEIKRIRDEWKTMKKDLNQLRQENSSLKEESLRSRVTYDTRSKGTTAKPSEIESHASPAREQLGISNYLIAICLIIFLLAIYIGKQL